MSKSSVQLLVDRVPQGMACLMKLLACNSPSLELEPLLAAEHQLLWPGSDSWRRDTLQGN